ncbi:MAG: DUF5777 family beta-barrel protein [Saprospiraceae bacterium]|jgi:hypothetical protein
MRFVFLLITIIPLLGRTQENLSLLSLLEEDETPVKVDAIFKTTRIINLPSIEQTSVGVLDIKISHRFGTLQQGAYDLFGLDNASIRIGAEYGIHPNLMIGLGRSGYEKTYDGYIKYKWLDQTNGKNAFPFSMGAFIGTSINTLKNDNWEFTDRASFVFQLLLARKFSNQLSLQLSPTVIHRNLVATSAEKNTVPAIGIGGRFKLSNRISLNVEYTPVFNNFIAERYVNSFSVGFDIETGGHVFQLHFTNAIAMMEKGYFTETYDTWNDGGVRFGFNIARVFNLKKPKLETY